MYDDSSRIGVRSTILMENGPKKQKTNGHDGFPLNGPQIFRQNHHSDRMTKKRTAPKTHFSDSKQENLIGLKPAFV